MSPLTPPLSKSDAQRALVLADALEVGDAQVLSGETELPGDVEVLRDGLRQLRAATPGDTVRLDCRDGGAPFRFLLTRAALTPGVRTEFTGTPRLGARPHGSLLTALEASLGPSGLRLTAGGPWPLVVEAPARPLDVTRFEVGGEESSQFASSLLLGAARVVRRGGHPCEVLLHGPLASEGYLQLTLQWLERTGFTVASDGRAHRVESHREVSPWPRVPGDWSSLTYLLPLSWRSGVPVSRVDLSAAHPDRRVVGHLASVGLRLEEFLPGLDRLGLSGPSLAGRLHCVRGQPTGGLDVDAAECPDAVPALAALAAVLPATSRFRRIGILRLKESDRVAGVCELLARAGASATVEGDTVRVEPSPLHDFEFDAQGDHRLAMAAATLSSLGQVACALRGGAAVKKSFPGFWAEAEKAGVQVRRLD